MDAIDDAAVVDHLGEHATDSDSPAIDAEGTGTDAHDSVFDGDAGGVDTSPGDALVDAGAVDAGSDETETVDGSETVESAHGDPDSPTAPATVVVLAGDSWSSGLVGPLRDALVDRGWTRAAVRWETTANAGSQARGWIANEHPPAVGGGRDTSRPRMLDALASALDDPPGASLLVLVIGGNDFNRECDAGWGEWGRWRQELSLEEIVSDANALVGHALRDRPGLRVAVVGYDYFHYEFLRAFGLRLDGLDTHSYNAGLVELSRRVRDTVSVDDRVVYTHNFGVLQHTYGDRIHPPFSIPNPLTGYPEYPPGLAPRPGPFPRYEPFPGGFITYPSPLDQMPDGIHPSPDGFRTIIDNALEQLPADWTTGWE